MITSPPIGGITNFGGAPPSGLTPEQRKIQIQDQNLKRISQGMAPLPTSPEQARQQAAIKAAQEQKNLQDALAARGLGDFAPAAVEEFEAAAADQRAAAAGPSWESFGTNKQAIGGRGPVQVNTRGQQASEEKTRGFLERFGQGPAPVVLPGRADGARGQRAPFVAGELGQPEVIIPRGDGSVDVIPGQKTYQDAEGNIAMQTPYGPAVSVRGGEAPSAEQLPAAVQRIMQASRAAAPAAPAPAAAEAAPVVQSFTTTAAPPPPPLTKPRGVTQRNWAKWLNSQGASFSNQQSAGFATEQRQEQRVDERFLRQEQSADRRYDRQLKDQRAELRQADRDREQETRDVATLDFSFLAQQAAEQGLPIGEQAVKQFATLKPSQQAAAVKNLDRWLKGEQQKKEADTPPKAWTVDVPGSDRKVYGVGNSVMGQTSTAPAAQPRSFVMPIEGTNQAVEAMQDAEGGVKLVPNGQRYQRTAEGGYAPVQEAEKTPRPQFVQVPVTTKDANGLPVVQQVPHIYDAQKGVLVPVPLAGAAALPAAAAAPASKVQSGLSRLAK